MKRHSAKVSIEIHSGRHIIQSVKCTDNGLQPEISMRALNWLSGLSLFLSMLAVCGLWILILTDLFAVFFLSNHMGGFELAGDLFYFVIVWGLVSIAAYAASQPAAS
jgi:hypothetical protein